MNNWQFNQKFIKETIDKGIVLLKNPIIPLGKRNSIKNELYIFNEFLNSNFDMKEPISFEKKFKSVEQLKKHILKIMEKQYKVLGRDMINLLLSLNESFEVGSYNVLPSGPDLTIEEQAEESLKMYKQYSEKFYNQAKEIVLNPNSLIHADYDLGSPSWGFYSDILDLPLLVIDPCESSSILTRELQKSIELSMKFPVHQLYKEMGPFYFEMLFNDYIFSKYRIFSKDYYDRLSEFKTNLQQIAPYLDFVLLFSNNNFKIETELFLECFHDMMSTNYTDTIKYINDEIISCNMEKYIMYCVSFLKAIEFRAKTQENKEKTIEELTNRLSVRREKYEVPEAGIILCQNFSEEVYKKSKKY